MTAPAAPKGLDARGRKLWRDVTGERTWDSAGLVLIGEACRLVDRLEKLDGLLRGDVAAWAELVDNYERKGGMATELQVDAGLTEARQMQTALLGILTKLGLGKSESTKSAAPSRRDELAVQRAQRLAEQQRQAPEPA